MSLPTTPLGRTGLDITRLGIGAWAMGGADWQGGWGHQDDRDSVAAIHHALDLGVSWIDTAAAYGLGHAETVVGRAIAGMEPDSRPLVFTKCGLVWDEGSTTVRNVLAPSSIRRECSDSLSRLGVDCIDLLQIHWPSHDGTPIEESWATMAELVDAGVVRHIGVSNFDVDLLERCEAVRHVDTVQPHLNLIAREAATSVLPWARRHQSGVIGYSPMRSGLLSGRFSHHRMSSLEDGDWRRADADFQEPRLSRNLALVDGLRPLAEQLGCSLPELAIAWTLAIPGVSGAIVGARRPEQVDGWIGAATVELTQDIVAAIAAVVEETGAGDGPCLPEAEAAGLGAG
ncbi:MAG: aldo/keto reductase [Candidatus Dormibacteria bacterium]